MARARLPVRLIAQWGGLARAAWSPRPYSLSVIIDGSVQPKDNGFREPEEREPRRTTEPSTVLHYITRGQNRPRPDPVCRSLLVRGGRLAWKAGGCPGSEIDQARIGQVRGLKFDGWRKMADQSPDELASDHQTRYPAVSPEPEWYRGSGLDLFGLAGGVCSPVRRRRDIIENLARNRCAGVPSQHLIRRGARPGLKFPCRNNSPRRSPRGLTWG